MPDRAAARNAPSASVERTPMFFALAVKLALLRFSMYSQMERTSTPLPTRRSLPSSIIREMVRGTTFRILPAVFWVQTSP